MPVNVGSALIPIAAAAVQTITQQLAEVARGSLSFARELAATTSDDGHSSLAMSSAAADLTPEGAVAAGQTQLEIRRDQIRVLLQSVHARLAPRFQEAGIDLSEPVTLAADPSGRILESGGHWDRAAVEQMVEADPQLTADLLRLLEQAGQLAASTAADGGVGEKTDIRLVLDARQAFFASPSA